MSRKERWESKVARNRVTRVEGLHSIESLEWTLNTAILKPRMKTMDSLTQPMFPPSPSNLILEKTK